MSDEIRGGLLEFSVDGEVYDAKGNFTYNLGFDKLEMMVGSDRVHGPKATPQVPFIEGEITDARRVNLSVLQQAKNVTVTLSKRNGKTVVISGAFYCHEGTGETEDGKIPVRFEGLYGEEVVN